MRHPRLSRTCLLVALALVVLAGAAPAKEEEAPRGWMGVQVRDLNEGEAEELGLDRDGGVMIARVVPESPAARAGLNEGDILLRAGAVRLANLAGLFEAMSESKPGERIGVAAWRDGEVFEVAMELGRMPPQVAEAARAGSRERRMAQLMEEQAAVHHLMEKARRRIDEVTKALIGAGREGKADRVRELANEMRELSMHLAELTVQSKALAERIEGARDAPKERGEDRERAAAVHQIEVMHLAAKAFAEADRKDLVGLMEKKIRAIQVALEGRRDREAVEIMEAAPGRGQVAECLAYAGRLYREFDMPDRAEWCERLGREFLAQHLREEEETGSREARIDRLEKRLAEMAKALVALKKELGELKQERR